MATNRTREVFSGLTWSSEKSGPVLAAESALIAASQPVAGESFCGGSIMECCNEFRCVCVCPGCGESSVTGMVCSECERAEEGDTVNSLGLSGLVTP